jgi:hypothetical protein
VRRGGFVSVVGVYGIPYKFPLGQIFDKGIKLAFGQAPVHKYIGELLTLIAPHTRLIWALSVRAACLRRASSATAPARRIDADQPANCPAFLVHHLRLVLNNCPSEKDSTLIAVVNRPSGHPS